MCVFWWYIKESRDSKWLDKTRHKTLGLHVKWVVIVMKGYSTRVAIMNSLFIKLNLKICGLKDKKLVSEVSHLVSRWKSCLSTRTCSKSLFCYSCPTYDSYTHQGTCKSALVCTHLTCTHAWCTCLVYTWILCMRVSTSTILRVHACLHACRNKNV